MLSTTLGAMLGAVALITPAQALSVEAGAPIFEADGAAFNLPGLFEFNLLADTPAPGGPVDLSIILAATLLDGDTVADAAITITSDGDLLASSDTPLEFSSEILAADEDLLSFLFDAPSGLDAALFADGLIVEVRGEFGPDPFGLGFGDPDPVPVNVVISSVDELEVVPLPGGAPLFLGALAMLGLRRLLWHRA
ncbi:MAG: hypothetical protein AAF416_12915 [Pseudomonadota bacterium]